MRHIEQYFSLIIRTIRRSTVVDDKVTYIVDNSLAGTIEGILSFQNGSRLEFTEQVSLRAGHPVKQVYRYQYIHKKRPIFRYDNAPHYPHLPTFPHHKHIENKVLATEEPLPSSRFLMRLRSSRLKHHEAGLVAVSFYFLYVLFWLKAESLFKGGTVCQPTPILPKHRCASFSPP